MSRRTHERWLEAQERWPNLQQFLGCYLHEDFSEMHKSVDGAIAAAIRGASLEMKRTILREWRDWNASESASSDIRPFLDEGFGVAVYFESPIDARNLMNRFYDEILAAVRTETSPASKQPGERGRGA